MLRSSLPSDRALKRFEIEAETLGRLRHPGIAQIYEAGVHESRPFFAMKFIDDVPINKFVSRRALSTTDTLCLLMKVFVAIQHAQQRGVIHRDLKPANILVVEPDHGTDPETKILDFGIAKLTESDVQVNTIETDIGQLIGTLAYMSPEQAAGDPTAIDTRSDVYSLGVLAFELLTGRLPHDPSDRLIHEAVRIIREGEPSRLNTLRGNVEATIATALEKNPSHRYETSAALASDIARYLNDQPIQARPASTWYQIRKFSRRNRSLVTGIAASFVLLIAGLITTSVFAVRADTARRNAAEAEQAAENALAASRAEDGYQLIQATYGPQHARSAGAAGLIVRIYEAWHIAAPEAGHDRTAAEWTNRG